MNCYISILGKIQQVLFQHTFKTTIKVAKVPNLINDFYA